MLSCSVSAPLTGAVLLADLRAIKWLSVLPLSALDILLQWHQTRLQQTKFALGKEVASSTNNQRISAHHSRTTFKALFSRNGS